MAAKLDTDNFANDPVELIISPLALISPDAVIVPVKFTLTVFLF